MFGPEDITLQDVLVTATNGIHPVTASAEGHDEQQPPPYQSQPPNTTQPSLPPQPATMITVKVGPNTIDLRYLVANFPDEPFWIKKVTESNKDHYRRICRFRFQGDFCTYRFFPCSLYVSDRPTGVLVDKPSFGNFWKKFAELMIEYKAVFRDWPSWIPAPGTPDFQINRLASDFVSDVYRGWRYDNAVNPIPYFEFWSQGQCLSCHCLYYYSQLCRGSRSRSL